LCLFDALALAYRLCFSLLFTRRATRSPKNRTNVTSVPAVHHHLPQAEAHAVASTVPAVLHARTQVVVNGLRPLAEVSVLKLLPHRTTTLQRSRSTRSKGTGREVD